MRLFLISIFAAIFFLAQLHNFVAGKQVDLQENDPVAMIQTQMRMWEGIKCRQGFKNLSNEMVDAAYHCANHPHDRLSRRKFTEERVSLSGPTPQLCQRVCVLAQVGVINPDLNGINESALLNLFTEQIGEASAKELSRNVMNCDKKYPTTFPKQFIDCKGTDDFIRCFVTVMTDCSRKAK